MIRAVAVAAFVVAVVLSTIPRIAQAGGRGGYPWCAHYSFGLNECNFFTWQQCQAALSGNGGTCDPNPRFRGYLPPQRRYLPAWPWG